MTETVNTPEILEIKWGPQINDTAILYCQKLSDKARLPRQATVGSIGLDLFAPIKYHIPPNEQVLIPADLMLVPSNGYYVQISSKSGLVAKHEITVEAGEVDPDYRGNVVVILRNHNNRKSYTLDEGEPMAQVILTMATIPEVIETQIAANKERGTSGLGSTYQK